MALEEYSARLEMCIANPHAVLSMVPPDHPHLGSVQGVAREVGLPYVSALQLMLTMNSKQAEYCTARSISDNFALIQMASVMASPPVRHLEYAYTLRYNERTGGGAILVGKTYWWGYNERHQNMKPYGMGLLYGFETRQTLPRRPLSCVLNALEPESIGSMKDINQALCDAQTHLADVAGYIKWYTSYRHDVHSSDGPKLAFTRRQRSPCEEPAALEQLRPIVSLAQSCATIYDKMLVISEPAFVMTFHDKSSAPNMPPESQIWSSWMSSATTILPDPGNLYKQLSGFLCSLASPTDVVHACYEQPAYLLALQKAGVELAYNKPEVDKAAAKAALATFKSMREDPAFRAFVAEKYPNSSLLPTFRGKRGTGAFAKLKSTFGTMLHERYPTIAEADERTETLVALTKHDVVNPCGRYRSTNHIGEAEIPAAGSAQSSVGGLQLMKWLHELSGVLSTYLQCPSSCIFCQSNTPKLTFKQFDEMEHDALGITLDFPNDHLLTQLGVCLDNQREPCAQTEPEVVSALMKIGAMRESGVSCESMFSHWKAVAQKPNLSRLSKSHEAALMQRAFHGPFPNCTRAQYKQMKLAWKAAAATSGPGICAELALRAHEVQQEQLKAQQDKALECVYTYMEPELATLCDHRARVVRRILVPELTPEQCLVSLWKRLRLPVDRWGAEIGGFAAPVVNRVRAIGGVRELQKSFKAGIVQLVQLVAVHLLNAASCAVHHRQIKLDDVLAAAHSDVAIAELLRSFDSLNSAKACAKLPNDFDARVSPLAVSTTRAALDYLGKHEANARRQSLNRAQMNLPVPKAPAGLRELANRCLPDGSVVEASAYAKAMEIAAHIADHIAIEATSMSLHRVKGKGSLTFDDLLHAAQILNLPGCAMLLSQWHSAAEDMQSNPNQPLGLAAAPRHRAPAPEPDQAMVLAADQAAWERLVGNNRLEDSECLCGSSQDAGPHGHVRIGTAHCILRKLSSSRLSQFKAMKQAQDAEKRRMVKRTQYLEGETSRVKEAIDALPVQAIIKRPRRNISSEYARQQIDPPERLNLEAELEHIQESQRVQLDEPLHCYCCTPIDPRCVAHKKMVCCSKCKNSYHPGCLGLDPEPLQAVVNGSTADWACYRCQAAIVEL